MSVTKFETSWNIKKLIRKFPTDEAIAAECGRTGRVSSGFGMGALLCLLTSLFTGGMSLVLTRAWPSLEQNPFVIGMGTTGILSIFAMLVLVVLYFELSNKAELLSPLSSSKYCVEANDLVNRYSAARAVRDNALESGRQLYVLDFVEIAHAAQCSYPDNEAELRRASCASIHKLNAEA